ncbi:glycerate dehydrogenase [Dactylonectria estremocensis]|uniref:Glycerate dehydrogenase n=1 Tax=Dactylonectria estremocensis TaxID=1079267 RepID=A0A9P9EBS5_9HYPO|nr:glycerate dehydrogenase [Dactylonectria estremocensis]
MLSTTRTSLKGKPSSFPWFNRRYSTSTVPSLAILDDYLSISQPHFKNIAPSALRIETFKSHLPNATPEQRKALIETLRPFSAISTMRERTSFHSSLFRELPNLKLLLCTGTQFETFDLEAAKRLGIKVVAAPGKGRTDQAVSTGAIVQDIKKGQMHPATHHTWAMLLALARNISADDAAIKAGGWQTDMAVGLTGKTLGIVGMGRLGAAVARIGILAFGMKVVCWSSSLEQAKADEMATLLGLPVENEFGGKSFTVVKKSELFRTADVVSLHYVLSERSRGIVGADEFAVMKKDALLVNTSRGPLVDETALLDAVRNGRIRGVALDVFEMEPLPMDSPWRTEDWGRGGRSRVLLTPHMGYVEEGIMNKWYAETAENVERWLAGEEVLHRLV